MGVLGVWGAFACEMLLLPEIVPPNRGRLPDREREAGMRSAAAMAIGREPGLKLSA
jgi:hypothetical protein